MDKEELKQEDTQVEEQVAEPTRRDKASAYLKEKYPDKEFAEDDDLMEALLEAASEGDTYRMKAQEVNQKLVDLFEAEPVIYNIIQDALNGAPGHVAIARHIDPEDLEAAKGDPDYAAWEENLGSRASKLEQKRNMEKEVEANIAQSMEQAQAFAEEKGLDEEQTMDFLGKVDDALADVYKGKVTKDFLNNMWKALNYEQGIEEAKTLGEAKGRNEKIVAQKEDKKQVIPDMASTSMQETEKAPERVGYIDRLKKK